MVEQNYLSDFISRAIAEDIGNGDHSSNCCIPAEATGKMHLLVKENGVLAGMTVAQAVFEQLDKSIKFTPLLKDGDHIKKGDLAFKLYGPERILLRGERLALNLMQRMSGIASKTAYLVSLIEGTSTRLLDTRKTTPNLRPLEKWAVKLGGGYNHRMGLYDMIMLKDNHIDFAGGIQPAIEKARAYLKQNDLSIPIEVETRDFDEIKAVMDCGGIQRIMFDNFSPADTLKAVELVNGEFETESSGGITENSIRAYAETGVDFISVGALTHSVSGLDMSLKAF
jgi:nicotinate-nucleotide pyrophosphorylase (carboxylating)